MHLSWSRATNNLSLIFLLFMVPLSLCPSLVFIYILLPLPFKSPTLIPLFLNLSHPPLLITNNHHFHTSLNSPQTYINSISKCRADDRAHDNNPPASRVLATTRSPSSSPSSNNSSPSFVGGVTPIRFPRTGFCKRRAIT